MTQFVAPGLGNGSGFVGGQDGWGDEYNADMLKMSVLINCAVLDRVSDLPASPTHGDIYLLTGTDDSNSAGDTDQIAAYYVEGVTPKWVYYTPVEGWSVWVIDEQVRYNYTEDGWVAETTGAAQPIDIGLFIGGTLSATELVAQYIATRDFDLPVDFDDSQAYAVVGDDTDLVLSIQKNGAEFGTVTLGADSNSGLTTVVFDSTATSFAAGDVLTVVAPASPGLWANVSITLAGTRS